MILKLAAVSLLGLFLVSGFAISPAQAIQPSKMQEVSITVGIELGLASQVIQWVKQYAGSLHFTFVIDGNGTDTSFTTHKRPYDWDQSWFFTNSTWFKSLSAYGDVIPSIPFALQVQAPKDRIAAVSHVLQVWRTQTGRYPPGVFAYQPDTVISNFLRNKGIGYILGYCFDQYQIDWMTERGGWQLPYYASRTNVLAPGNRSAGGTVILPYVTWDWLASFTVNHDLDGEPSGIPVDNATAYLIGLISASFASSSPFLYFGFSFFFGSADLPTIGQVLHWVIRQHYLTMPASQFVVWFRDHYRKTPTYSVNFVSPYDGQSVEWYYSQSYRIARTNGSVVSFVDYTKQAPDRFLTGEAIVNFSLPHTGTNNIDNSLSFVIDGLGGGLYRAPVRDPGVPFSGSLASFPAWYYGRA